VCPCVGVQLLVFCCVSKRSSPLRQQKNVADVVGRPPMCHCACEQPPVHHCVGEQPPVSCCQRVAIGAPLCWRAAASALLRQQSVRCCAPVELRRPVRLRWPSFGCAYLCSAASACLAAWVSFGCISPRSATLASVRPCWPRSVVHNSVLLRRPPFSCTDPVRPCWPYIS
jgi:hypothetical protein